MTKRWQVVPYGTLICAVIIGTVLSSVSSQQNNARRGSSLDRRAPAAQNETLLNEIEATGKMIKRVGEFASRALWMRRGKFIFPSGTIFSLAPKITVPGFRRKAFKGALNSDIQATWFLYVYCDKLGITSDMHPFPFDRPPFYPFGPLMRPIEGKDGGDKKDEKKEKKPVGKPMDQYPFPYESPMKHGYGEEDGSSNRLKQDTVYTFFPIQKRAGGAASEQQENQQQQRSSNSAAGNARRSNNGREKRSVMSLPPPEKHPGGERAMILPGIENMMSNLGFQGKGCMLRAICEIHEFPLQQGYGLLGEMIALFFSVSQSPYAESHMPEYLKAEDAGRNGDCSKYKSMCAKSVFKWEVVRKHDVDEEEETNYIPNSPYRSKFEDDEL